MKLNIITIPHPTLRTPAQAVTQVDAKLRQFVSDLQETLGKKMNPKGVGLAAPQVETRWRVFATQLTAHPDEPEEKAVLRAFINPEIIDHSAKRTFGPRKDEPVLEGCLSMPGFYGPVPRWEWVQLQYQVLVGNELRTKKEKFSEFAARVVQHEYDHLEGILFSDYIAELGLPLYQENQKNNKLYEMEDEMIQAFVEATRT